MRPIKFFSGLSVLCIFWASPSLCRAQTINISGLVKDSATNTPVKDVIVRLANAALLDTTDAAGLFSIKRSTMEAAKNVLWKIGYTTPVLTHNGALQFSIGQKENILIKTFSLPGKLVSSVQKECPAGAITVFPGKTAAGVYLYQIRIHDKTYTLKNIAVSPSGKSPQNSAVTITGTPSPPGDLAKSQATFADTLIFTLSGYAVKKIPVANPDSTDITVLLKNIAAMADVFVSPAGDDAAAGTLVAPVATLHQAKLLIAAKLAAVGGQARDFTVMFRGGTYYLTATEVF
ncbi:MAG: hypothetical protein PHC61_15535, partial [Chitinivibrionales bacterium]|nr:hypothetical protein [Chitinivibrionales bacterium]